MPRTHPIHRRYYAEDIVRLRRAGEKRRYAASQRRGRVDPNPHQIEAVMFALRRIPDGGCILADEVGLGKTIEAGLVLAQLLAEGASRILILLPRPLLGQWQEELYTLFGIRSLDASSEDVDPTGPGVFLAGREYAGAQRGFERLSAGSPFDLCIIDEAHEVFAGIHRRFDRHGVYLEDSKAARTAHQVRKLIGPTPVLLLTATPLQNSLAEIWGLVHFIEPTGTLLGSLPTFKELFCVDGDARRVAPDRSEELRRRLSQVVQRTLRRQATEFLERPFVGRRAQLFEYSMSSDERSLYEDVTLYLLAPNLCAFRGRSRQLLLLGFHRRMASSTMALAQSLERVADRLRRMLDGNAPDEQSDLSSEFFEDLEDEEVDEEPIDEDLALISPEAIRAELDRVEQFVLRARALPHDSKAESLVKAVALVTTRESGPQKVVVFTESLTTQDYLRALLMEQGGLSDTDITVFRGVNDSPRAREALRQWRQEVAPNLPANNQPTDNIAVRLALVHEFKTRSQVFISTEAGAKGLNLQFCDTLINYDLPWNPQRIEQRIGRCHRYGQTRDVTVINFLAKDNEAQRLTLEILSSKLDLFGEVLDMSDVVLHSPRSGNTGELAASLGPDFELQLRRIWDRARSIEEVESELARLRDNMEDHRKEYDRARERTIGLIESRLDDNVREVFRTIQTELPETLAELDRDLERVVVSYLDAVGVNYQLETISGRETITIPAAPGLPPEISAGMRVALGASHDLQEIESLHSAHQLVEAALAEARESGAGQFCVSLRLKPDSSEALQQRRGDRGRLALTRISHRGFEREDRLIVTALFESSSVLRPAEAALELLQLPCSDADHSEPELAVSRSDLDEVVDEELFFDQSVAAKSEQERFEQAIDQIDQYAEDRALVVRRAREERNARLLNVEQKRDAALGSDARSRHENSVRRLAEEVEQLDLQLGAIESRDDDAYTRWMKRAHDRRYGAPKIERLLEAEFILE